MSLEGEFCWRFTRSGANRSGRAARVGPPLLSPQDCVQLNQYKLKDEIGKVSVGWAWGGTGGFALQLVRR